MKPPLFHVGQAVVCIASRWPGGQLSATPKKDQIYKVVKLHNDFGIWWLELAEFPPCPCPAVWSEDRFVPVEEMPANAYAELLEALEPVTA